MKKNIGPSATTARFEKARSDYLNLVGFGHLMDDGDVPSKQSLFLSPRYEPSNITTNADVMRIQSAIRDAEAGQTEQLFRFYRDVLLSDDHIAGEFNTRKLALLSQPLAILPEDKNNPDDVALAKAMLVAINDCENWEEGMKALLGSTAIWPVAVLERLYKPGNQSAAAGRAGIPGLKFTLNRFVPVNPQLLCYQWAYMMGGVGLGTGSAIQVGNIGLPGQGGPVNREYSTLPGTKGRQGAIGEPTDGSNPWYTIDLEVWEPYIKLWPIDMAGRIIYDVTHAEYLDPARHVVHRGHDLTEFRDNWGGPGRCLLPWWLFMNLGREWFARGLERFGSPWPVAYTDVKDPEAVNLLRQAFDMFKKIGGIIVDENSKIEFQEAMVQGFSDGYNSFLDRCKGNISARITGLKESKKPAGLNSGEGQFQQTVREDVRVNDQMCLAKTCKRQILWPFRDLNGLKGDCKFVWGGLSVSDAKTFADLLYTMKQASFQPTADSMPTINERTGLSWEIVTAPAPGGAENPKVTQFSAAQKPHWLLSGVHSPQSTVHSHENPVGDLPDRYKQKLAAAFRGTNAPVAKILRDSTSAEDFLKKLRLFYADYDPARVVAIAEEALQVAAAAGAAKATEQK